MFVGGGSGDGGADDAATAADGGGTTSDMPLLMLVCSVLISFESRKIDSSRGKCSAHQFSVKTYFSLHVCVRSCIKLQDLQEERKTNER